MTAAEMNFYVFTEDGGSKIINLLPSGSQPKPSVLFKPSPALRPVKVTPFPRFVFIHLNHLGTTRPSGREVLV